MFTSLLSSVSDYIEQKHHTETGSPSVSDYREQKYHTKTGSQSVSGHSEYPYSEHNKHKPPSYSPDNDIIQCDCTHSRQWCHANQSTKSIHTPIPLHLHPTLHLFTPYYPHLCKISWQSLWLLPPQRCQWGCPGSGSPAGHAACTLCCWSMPPPWTSRTNHGCCSWQRPGVKDTHTTGALNLTARFWQSHHDFCATCRAICSFISENQQTIVQIQILN